MVKKSCKINIKNFDAERFVESGVFIRTAMSAVGKENRLRENLGDGREWKP